jgi:hypothetical protein
MENKDIVISETVVKKPLLYKTITTSYFGQKPRIEKFFIPKTTIIQKHKFFLRLVYKHKLSKSESTANIYDTSTIFAIEASLKASKLI